MIGCDILILGHFLTIDYPCVLGAKSETPLKIPRFVLKSVYVVDVLGKPTENRHWHEDALDQVVYFMYCCREDKQLLLRLPPSTDGYYLGSSSGLCSHIPGTLLDRERITNYLTAPPNTDQFIKMNDGGSVLYRELAPTMEGMQLLCYYHPSKGIDYSTWAVESSFSNLVNLTEKDVEKMAGEFVYLSSSSCLIDWNHTLDSELLFEKNCFVHLTNLTGRNYLGKLCCLTTVDIYLGLAND